MQLASVPQTSADTTAVAGTVADQIAATLAAIGVKRIYGVVGDSLNGLTDALELHF